MSAEREARALLGAGRPLRLSELERLLGLGAKATRRSLQELSAALTEAQLGFEVEEVAGGYRLVVPPQRARQLAPLLAPPALPPLSGAALEVLAVIAYRQPITRAEIEAMRGGSVSSVVTLQERELVKVLGHSPAVGQPLLYGTTERFLLEFGLRSLQDLPDFTPGGQEFSQLLRS